MFSKSILLVLLLTFTYLPFLSTGNGIAGTDQELKVSYLQKKPDDGCGCGFYDIRDARKRLIVEGDYADVIWINIDGRDIRLKQEGPEQKKGKYSVVRYRSNDITVRTELYKTGEGYESVDLEGFVIVIRGKQKTFVKVKGGCGC